jgi:hypothetical protein
MRGHMDQLKPHHKASLVAAGSILGPVVCSGAWLPAAVCLVVNTAVLVSAQYNRMRDANNTRKKQKQGLGPTKPANARVDVSICVCGVCAVLLAATCLLCPQSVTRLPCTAVAAAAVASDIQRHAFKSARSTASHAAPAAIYCSAAVVDGCGCLLGCLQGGLGHWQPTGELHAFSAQYCC